jgi:uncharacterized protein YwgA
MAISKNLFGVLYLINSFSILEHRIRFQKLVLISKLGYNYPFSFKFERYKFGPYSFELQRFLSSLISDGLITESDYKFKLTELGKKILGEMKNQADKEIIKSLDNVFKAHSKTSVSDLIVESKKLFNW